MPTYREPYVVEWYAFGRAEGGGPVRWIANGHRTHAVGLLPLNKSRHIGSPWESRAVESVVLRMLAVCSRVVDIVAQPHSLFIGLRGIKRQLRYTPDIEVRVHPSFRDELVKGRPLHEIVAAPFVEPSHSFDPVALVFELKSDSDQTVNDDVAKMKMDIVKAVYGHAGHPFFTLHHTPHIDRQFTDTLMFLEIAANDRVGALERSRCVLAFGGEMWLPFSTLSAELGGQPQGERLVKALHYKHAVSIDLSRGLSAGSPVWLRLAGEQSGNG